jgi:hypothetical protein
MGCSCIVIQQEKSPYLLSATWEFDREAGLDAGKSVLLAVSQSPKGAAAGLKDKLNSCNGAALVQADTKRQTFRHILDARMPFHEIDPVCRHSAFD